jgi:hypothetical protein
MGRAVIPRVNYVKDSQSVYRLREALRTDPSLSDSSRAKAVDAATSLMAVLMKIDEERGITNVRKKAS